VAATAGAVSTDLPGRPNGFDESFLSSLVPASVQDWLRGGLTVQPGGQPTKPVTDGALNWRRARTWR
jgi:hypothetical protein